MLKIDYFLLMIQQMFKNFSSEIFLSPLIVQKLFSINAQVLRIYIYMSKISRFNAV